MTAQPSQTMTAPSASVPAVDAGGRPALRALDLTEARRFARHPLFLLGVSVMLVPMVVVVWQQRVGANPTIDTLLVAFLIGVFGVAAQVFVTALPSDPGQRRGLRRAGVALGAVRCSFLAV